MIAYAMLRVLYSARGLLLIAILIASALVMGACHSTYDDWMNG